MFDTEKFICEVEQRPPLYDVSCKEYSNKDVKAKCWVEVGEAMYADWNDIPMDKKDERGKELMKKWKAIRDAFVRDHRKVTAIQTGQSAKKQKRYVYYDQLQFLLAHVKGNANTSSNICFPSPSATDNFNEDANTSSTNNDEGIADDLTQLEAGTSGTSQTHYTPPAAEKKKRHSNQYAGVTKKVCLEQSVAASAKQLTSILSESLELQKEQRQKEELADRFGHKQFLTSFVPILDSLPLHAAMQARSEISQVVTRIVQTTQTNTVTDYDTPTPESNVMDTISEETSSSFCLSKYINM